MAGGHMDFHAGSRRGDVNSVLDCQPGAHFFGVHTGYHLPLRDDPGAIHLTLDSAGWADINNLLTRANRYGFKLTREDLADVLTASEDQRFEWDQPGGRIRWSKS